MMFRLVAGLAEEGFSVTVTCRVLGVSRSRYYEWSRREPSARQLADQDLMRTIREIHRMSRGTYGVPRIHAELRLGMSIQCGRKRGARLMGADGLQGVCHRCKRGHIPAQQPMTIWSSASSMPIPLIGSGIPMPSIGPLVAGLLLRGDGCLEPQDRGLGHRRSHPG